MKRYLLLTAIVFFGSCKTVPLTGRKQLSLISSSQVQSLSYDQYSTVISEAQLSSNAEWTGWVKDVGNDIKNAVEQYLNSKGQGDLLKGYKWDFNLIEDDQMVNAWCMPGGKVAFYTGIMPICKDKNGVAVVMGHEVAHAIARHGAERMSQGMVQQLGGVALAVAVRDKPAETQALFLGAYGIASTVGGMLPFSRLHESEADELGLTFMAMAGYDPRVAPDFWKRMSDNSGGNQPPEFISTHPNHSTRIANLNRWMPDAMRYYNESK